DWPAWSDPPMWSQWNWDVNWDIDWSYGGQTPSMPERPERPERPGREAYGARAQGLSGWADWSGWFHGGAYRLVVFETLEELRERVPPELYDATQQALKGSEIEDLDI